MHKIKKRPSISAVKPGDYVNYIGGICCPNLANYKTYKVIAVPANRQRPGEERITVLDDRGSIESYLRLYFLMALPEDIEHYQRPVPAPSYREMKDLYSRLDAAGRGHMRDVFPDHNF